MCFLPTRVVAHGDVAIQWMLYVFVLIAVTCDLYSELTEKSGYIGNLPPNYENRESCSWKITAPAHKVEYHCIYWIVFVIAILHFLFTMPILDAYVPYTVLSARPATKLNTDIQRYTDVCRHNSHLQKTGEGSMWPLT